MSTDSVTVFGLGPMGQAMIRTFLEAGHAVTVWNRTPERADDVVAAGAELATTPVEAVSASDLIILSLTDYQAMWDVLGDATAALAGRTIVNLSSDTPDKTRDAATWIAKHGAAFLTGGVMVPAIMVGTEMSYVYYSGDEQAFDTHRARLASIGEPKFLGADPGRAQLMYQAHLDLFLTTLSGFVHATALVGSAGITAESFLPEAMRLFRAIPDMMGVSGNPRQANQEHGITEFGRRVDAGQHPGDGANITMMAASADHIEAASAAVGIDTALPRAVQAYYQRAIADGYGSDGWTRIIDSIRNPRPIS